MEQNKSSNKKLQKANKLKNDEFYTRIIDIENELKHYKDQFRGRVVFCNCDDPFESNFFKYFASNFKNWGLKKLIATSYTKSPIAGTQLSLFQVEGLEPDGKQPFKIEIKGVPDGDGDGAVDLSDVQYLLRHDKKADELWCYFQNVIAWTRATFINYRREMNSVEWGELYNKFKGKKFNREEIEAEIAELMQDEDVTNKSGIYPYVLTRQEKYLSIRAFTDKMKREAYERQKGKCSFCKKKFDISEMEADHITPWHEGGKTIAKNFGLSHGLNMYHIKY